MERSGWYLAVVVYANDCSAYMVFSVYYGEEFFLPHCYGVDVWVLAGVDCGIIAVSSPARFYYVGAYRVFGCVGACDGVW